MSLTENTFWLNGSYYIFDIVLFESNNASEGRIA